MYFVCVYPGCKTLREGRKEICILASMYIIQDDIRCNTILSALETITKAAYTLAILPDARTVRERYASGCPCSHCVHCVGFVRYTQTTSGCACLQTDLFISNDSIHMTRKGDICHELSTCNWVTTGREADTVCTRRSGRVPFASGQSFVV